MTELLKITNLNVEFPTRRGRFQAVRGVNLTVKAGEVLGLVGESGAGKSTIGNAIIDLLEAPGQISGGSILFEGEELCGRSELEMRRLRGNRIGMIFQDPQTSLNPLMTVGAQLVETIEKTNDLRGSEVEGRAIELLELVGIPDAERRLGDYPHQFSGGMRQRVMIAIALACDPEVLIADEPTTALDVTIQAQIIELVKELRAKLGMAIVWITHDLGVIAGIADRVIVMYGGQVVEQAPVRELFANPQHPYTRALLKTIPSVTGQRETRLRVIEGQPPIMGAAPVACPFMPRCAHAFSRCGSENPQRRAIGAGRVGYGHDVACHWDATSGGPADA